MSTLKNDTGIREKVQGRKPRLNVLVNNYLAKYESRIHQADIDEVISKLQKINGLKPAPVVAPAAPVTGEATVVAPAPSPAVEVAAPVAEASAPVATAPVVTATAEQSAPATA